MRKAGWIRLGVATAGSATLILGSVLGIVYSTKGDKQSHDVLRVVNNAVKTHSWYAGDSSANYGPNASLEDGLISAKLFLDSTIGIEEYSRNKPNLKNPWSKINNRIHLAKFDLTDYILLKDKDGKYIGIDTNGGVTERIDQGLYGTLTDVEKKKYQWDDKVESVDTSKNQVVPGDKSLISLKFPLPNKETSFIKAAKLAKGGFDLHVRENIPWIDSKGNIKRNPSTNKPYLLQVRDFYYSMVRTLMGGSEVRLMPKTPQNPFGGFEDKRGYPLSEKDNQIDSQISSFQRTLDSNANSTRTNLANKDNYPNNYLFGLYKYKGLIQMVTPMSAGEKAPLKINATSTTVTNWKTAGLVRHWKQNLLSFDTLGSTATEKDKVSFADTVSNLKGLLFKVLSQTQELSPAPSDYIENEVAKRKLKLNNGKEISVPNGLVKALGFATYAIKIEDALTVGPMYYSESTTNRNKFKKNTHYWNQKWVKSPHSVNTYIVDYVLQPDKILFGQAQLSAFKSGRIAQLALKNQSKNKILELQQSRAAIFSMGSQSISSVGSLVPNLIPFSKNGKYNFNNAYSKLVYGVPITELSQGKTKTIQNFTSPKSISFRSLIGAAINWFTFAKELQPDNSKIAWNTAVPPNMQINPDGSNKSEEFIDYLEQINSVHAYVPKGKTLVELKDGTKSAGDWSNSRTWFINHSSNANLAMTSKKFKEIQKKMKELLDSEFPGDEQVVFELRNYWSNYIDYKNGFDSVAKVLNSIYPKKLRIGDINDPNSRGYILTKYPTAAARNEYFNRSSFVRGQGWGADYQGFGTMLTYFDIFGSVSLSTAIKKRSTTLPEYKKLFKEIIAYATIFEHEYQGLYDTYIKNNNDLKAAIKPSLLCASDLENGTQQGERLSQALLKPDWKSKIKDEVKQKEVQKFIDSIVVPFESIIDRKIQVNGLSQSADKTLPANVREAYKALSTNAGIINLIRQLKDVTGMIPDSRATVSDPTSPVASLVQTYLQISYSSHPGVTFPLNILVDVPRDERKTFREWI